MHTYYVIFGIFVTMLFFGTSNVDATTIKQTMDGAMDVSIQYPDSVIAGRDFAVSVFIQNNGWEDKQDISLVIDTQNSSIIAKNQTLSIDRLSKGGSFGGTLEFSTISDAEIGTHYLNGLYSQVILSNNEKPLPKTQKNIALEIELKGTPEVQLNTVTPTSVFPNAEFPFDVEIISKDIPLSDVSIQIVPPPDVSVRGQTLYTYSTIEKNTPISIRTQIVTNPAETTSEHKIPFEVTLTYTDDAGQAQTTSKTVSLLLRPRTFMEFTTDGGVWVGSVFLAPYVSMGTIIGIPAGTLFSLMIRRLQKKKRGKRKK